MVLSSDNTSPTATTTTTTNRKTTRIENNWLFLTTFLLLASILLLLSSSSSFTNSLFDVGIHRLLPSTEEIKQKSGGYLTLIGSDLITTTTTDDEAGSVVVVVEESKSSNSSRSSNSYFRQSEVLSKKMKNITTTTTTTTTTSSSEQSEVSNKTKKDVSSSSSTPTSKNNPSVNVINNNNNIFFPREPLPRTWEIESSSQSHQNQNQNQKQKQQQPLALLHIPKTGGSSIEEAASIHGLGWGKCAFLNGEHGCNIRSQQQQQNDNNWDNNNNNNITFDNAWTQDKVPYWHVPIQYLPTKVDVNINPYKNHDVFAVIRNPYQRAVSAYYFNSRHVFKSGIKNDTIERLNDVLQDKLLHVKSNKFYHGGHWIPQYDFIYDDGSDSNNSNTATTTTTTTTTTRRRRRMVKHIISFEYLETEFNSLMESYGLQNVVTLSDGSSNNGGHHKANSVTNFIKPMYSSKDLSVRTRQLIEEIYFKDFELGNYNKL